MQDLAIVACIKPVPDPRRWAAMELDPRTKTIRREETELVINPLDKNALEAALQLRETVGGSVNVITMAPPAARQIITETLAMGADRGIHLCDRVFAGADTLATSYTLAAGMVKVVGKPDLVFCGARSIDGSTGQVGPQLAVHLECCHVSSVSRIKLLPGNELLLRMQLEDTYLDFAAAPPLVVTVNGSCNNPRSPTLEGILSAESKEVITLRANELDVETNRLGAAGSPTCTRDLFFPDLKRQGEILSGSTEEAVEALIDKLFAAGVINGAR